MCVFFFFCRREAYKRTLNNDGKDNTKKGKSCSCGRRERRNKKKKQMYKDGMEGSYIFFYVKNCWS